MSNRDHSTEPWERQPEESTRAFEAFQMYRDMGVSRNLKAVASKLDKSVALIGRWSTEKSWVKRCEAWDNEQDRVMRLQQIDDIKKMRITHATIASSMMIKAAKALQSLPVEEIKAVDISRMVEVASKLERISRGDVGEVVEERDGGKADDRIQFYIPSNGRDSDEEDDDDL